MGYEIEKQCHRYNNLFILLKAYIVFKALRISSSTGMAG